MLCYIITYYVLVYRIISYELAYAISCSCGPCAKGQPAPRVHWRFAKKTHFSSVFTDGGTYTYNSY